MLGYCGCYALGAWGLRITAYGLGLTAYGGKAASSRRTPKKSARGVGLFVGHGENAVPAGGWFVEEVFLATLPVGTRRTIVLPFVEHGLEGFLRGGPLALAVEFPGDAEVRDAG